MITLTFSYFSPGTLLEVSKGVERISIEVFSNKWIDTSNVGFFFFGHEFDNYQVEEITERPKIDGLVPYIEVIYSQSFVQHEVIWQVQSLDSVLGVVGGFVGLIWSTLNLVLGGYEAFKLENSLIGAIYPTSP